jgi:integrase
VAHIEKRPRGDGTVGYRVKWRDPDSGKKDGLTFDDPKQADNLKKLLDANGQRLVDAQKVAAAIVRNTPTVAEVIEHHIEHLTGVQRRTKQDYRRDARNHINPHLGGIPIDALDSDRVKQWINDLADPDDEDLKPMSPKTLRNIHSLLSAAVGSAVPKWRPDNPVKGIRLPKYVPEEMVFLTQGEFSLLLSHIPYPYKTFIRFLASTGLRWGEAVVLTVGDFDLMSATPTVRVSKALKRDEQGHYTGTPKSLRSVRTVSLAKSLVPDLAVGSAVKATDDLAFTGPHGGRLHHGNFRSRVWVPAVERANSAVDSDGHPIPRELRLNKTPRIHDLRHSHASWLIAAGVDLPTVQRRLGPVSKSVRAIR